MDKGNTKSRVAAKGGAVSLKQASVAGAAAICPIETPAGDVSREATAPLSGFLYQDYRTALAWFQLRDDELLFVEVAEDYVKATSADLVATQVKKLSRKITLNDPDARDALANFVDFVSRNKHHRIKYAFLTTALTTVEKLRKHRPVKVGGIEYWKQVRSGADIAPLRQALLAMKLDQRVKTFIDARTDDQLRDDMVMRFEWVTGAEPLDVLKERLTEAVVVQMHTRDIQRHEAKKYVANVLNHVREVAVNPDRDKRRLCQGDLKELLDSMALRSIPNAEFEELTRMAVIASNLPIAQLDQHVEERITILKHSRYFVGFDRNRFAKKLADAVRIKGQYAATSPPVRANAISWAARVLIDDEPELAAELLDAADELDPDLPNLRFVQALRIGKESLDKAMEVLLSFDSPEANTTRYLIHRRASAKDAAVAAAISWFKEAGLAVPDLDEDGQALLLTDLMHAGQWLEATKYAADVETSNLRHPYLLLVCATEALCEAVPEDRRDDILDTPPVWDPLSFPLSDTREGLEQRARGASLFRRAQSEAEALGLEFVGHHADEYVLWLTLAEHPADQEARQTLESRIVAEKGWEQWIPLAISSDIGVDIRTARQRLDQAYARRRGENFHSARALLAILLASAAKTSPQEWKQIKPRLAKYFEPNLIVSFEVRACLRDQNVAGARAAIETLEGESADQWRRNLEIEIAGFSGEDTLTLRRQEFLASNSAVDLHALILELHRQEQWNELVGRTREMFSRMKNIESAERYVDALKRNQQWDDLVQFLEVHPEFISRSVYIADAYVRIRLLSADWKEVERAVQSGNLSDHAKNAVRLRLAALSLQWQDFNGLIDAALKNYEAYAPEALLQLASIAATIERKKDSILLTGYAAGAAPGDPQLLMSAYVQATRNMLDDDESVGSWLQTAIGCSDEGGPLVKMSVADLIEMAPQWRKHHEAAWTSLQSGEIWLEVYARQMNRRLSDVIAAPAITNQSEPDVRRRTIIPAFSGARSPVALPEGSRVAFDATALLTLSHLNLLDKILDTFGKVYVPYQTGAWLLDEFQHVDFHQPRRVEDAERLISYIAKESIGICPAPVQGDSALTEKVGVELSDLLRYATERQADGKEAFVIRTSPVPLVASMLEKNADLEACGGVLRSVKCLIATLHAQGMLGAAEADRANAYIECFDKGWNGDAEIPESATLLLDDLAVSYLQTTGLLQKLVTAGFTLLIHQSTREQANEYEAVKDASRELRRVLTVVRDFLSAGVLAGTVGVLPAPKARWEEPTVEPSVTVDLIEPQGQYDALVIDDRFFNRFAKLQTKDGAGLSVHCTLDVLDTLKARGSINDTDWRSRRTELRRSGFSLVPLLDQELTGAIGVTQVRSGKVNEALELRAIRENTALVQLRGTLLLPPEAPWVDGFMRSCNVQLDEILKAPESERKEVLLGWVLELADLRQFGTSLPKEITVEGLRVLRLAPYLRLVTNCMFTVQRRGQQAAVTALLESIKWFDPTAHAWIRDQLIRLLVDLKAKLQSSSGEDASPDVIDALVGQTLDRLPESIRGEIMLLERTKGMLGIPILRSIHLNIDENPVFDLDALWEGEAKVYNGREQVQLKDSKNRDWTLGLNESGEVSILVGDALRPLPFPDIEFASQDLATRMNYLEAVCARSAIDPGQLHDILEQLRAGPMNAVAAEDARISLEVHPLPLQERMLRRVRDGEATNGDLFPDRIAYYEGLVGPWNGEQSVVEFAEHAWNNPGAAGFDAHLKRALLLSGHSSTAPTALIRDADAEELRRFIASEADRLDIWSLTALLDGLMRRTDAVGGLVDQLVQLLTKLDELLSLESRRPELARVLFEAADLRLRAVFAERSVPPYWRRLAAIAHAAVIERAWVESGANIDPLIQHLESMAYLERWGSLVDMQREPHWSPILLAEKHLRLEFFNRVASAWTGHLEGTERWEKAGDKVSEVWKRLSSQRSFLRIPLLGPVEGGVDLPELPEDISPQMEELLTASDVPLLNRRVLFAMVGTAIQLPRKSLEILLSQIEDAGTSAFDGRNEDERSRVLGWLGFLAATNRDISLAKAVVRLARAMSPDAGAAISAVMCLYLSVTCAAAYENREEWLSELGECAAHAAHARIEKEEAIGCMEAIRGLTNADWTLVLPLARARVALVALINKR